MRSREDGASSFKTRRRIFVGLCLISFGLGGLCRLKDVPDPPLYRDGPGLVQEKPEGVGVHGRDAVRDTERVAGGRTTVLQEVRFLGQVGVGR